MSLCGANSWNVQVVGGYVTMSPSAAGPSVAHLSPFRKAVSEAALEE